MFFAPQRCAPFQLSTSKSAPELKRFVHFHLKMCFAPQQHAVFEHQSQLPKVLRSWCVFNILTSKFASPHGRVRFFDISTSKSGLSIEHEVLLTVWLRNVFRATTACNFWSLISPDGSALTALASLLFDPPEPQNIGKNTALRDFSTFLHTCIILLLTFSLLWSSLFFLNSS